MLQSEEQAMTESSEILPHSLAMFAFNKSSGNPQSQSYNHSGSNRGKGGGRYNNNGNQQQFYSSQPHQNYPPQGYSS